MSDCIFCLIAQNKLPAKKTYEDEHIVAFHDIQPAADTHFLIIPKQHITSLYELQAKHQDLMGHLLLMAAPLAKEQGATNGFRTIINSGEMASQEVPHLHVHILSAHQPLGPLLSSRT